MLEKTDNIENRPGSTPEQAIRLSDHEIAAINAGHQISSLLNLGLDRLFVETDQPQRVQGTEQTPNARVYTIWGITTNPEDFGTRVDDMERFRRTADGEVLPA
jgi:hypothetical protein